MKDSVSQRPARENPKNILSRQQIEEDIRVSQAQLSSGKGIDMSTVFSVLRQKYR